MLHLGVCFRYNKGSLDHLFFQTEEFENVDEYTSISWPLCHSFQSPNSIFYTSRIYFDYNQSSTITKNLEDAYCEKITSFAASCYPPLDGALDCNLASYLGIDATNFVYCEARNSGQDKITVAFPDIEPLFRGFENYGACESNFIKNFNDRGSEIHKTLDKIQIYAVKFDLSDLGYHTSENRTKEVVVFADTIFMSKDLFITYQLILRARRVFINKRLLMQMDMPLFLSSQKYHTYMEEHYLSPELKLRHRKYALVDILDTHIATVFEPLSCLPIEKPFQDIHRVPYRYESLFAYLNYVCTLSIARSNPTLALEISHWHLKYSRYASDDVIVSNILSAQKFKMIKDKIESDIHFVPRINFNKRDQLIQNKLEKFKLYREAYKMQDTALQDLANNYTRMDIMFQQLMMQLDAYEKSEREILDRITATSEIEIEIDREHRNLLADFMRENFEISRNAIEQIAKNQVGINKDVTSNKIASGKNMVAESEKKLERIRILLKECSRAQNEEIRNIEESEYNLKKAESKLKAEIRDEQILNIFSAIVQVGISIAGMFLGLPPNLSALSTIQSIKVVFDIGVKIYGMMEGIADSISKGQDLEELFSDVGSGRDFDSRMQVQLRNDGFLDVVEQVSEAKRHLKTFDRMKSQSDTLFITARKKGDFASVDDVKIEMDALADAGKRWLTQMVEFADLLFDYVNEQDRLLTLKKDLENDIDHLGFLDNATEELIGDQEKTRKNVTDAIRRYEELSESIYRVPYLQRKRFGQVQNAVQKMKEKEERRYQENASKLAQKMRQSVEASLVSRLSLMEFFRDYCDAIFYLALRPCDIEYLFPSLDDEYNDILAKIIELDEKAQQIHQSKFFKLFRFTIIYNLIVQRYLRS